MPKFYYDAKNLDIFEEKSNRTFYEWARVVSERF